MVFDRVAMASSLFILSQSVGREEETDWVVAAPSGAVVAALSGPVVEVGWEAGAAEDIPS